MGLALKILIFSQLYYYNGNKTDYRIHIQFGTVGSRYT